MISDIIQKAVEQTPRQYTFVDIVVGHVLVLFS